MTLPEIIWIGTSDDFTAICGDYILRVEQMGTYKWWHCTYFKDYQLTVNANKRTELEAKQAAEIEFYKHYIQQL